jgi:hypothetical protein
MKIEKTNNNNDFPGKMENERKYLFVFKFKNDFSYFVLFGFVV